MLIIRTCDVLSWIHCCWLRAKLACTCWVCLTYRCYWKICQAIFRHSTHFQSRVIYRQEAVVFSGSWNCLSVHKPCCLQFSMSTDLFLRHIQAMDAFDSSICKSNTLNKCKPTLPAANNNESRTIHHMTSITSNVWSTLVAGCYNSIQFGQRRWSTCKVHASAWTRYIVQLAYSRRLVLDANPTCIVHSLSPVNRDEWTYVCSSVRNYWTRQPTFLEQLRGQIWVELTSN